MGKYGDFLVIVLIVTLIFGPRSLIGRGPLLRDRPGAPEAVRAWRIVLWVGLAGLTMAFLVHTCIVRL
jgi:hypothetical protein